MLTEAQQEKKQQKLEQKMKGYLEGRHWKIMWEKVRNPICASCCIVQTRQNKQKSTHRVTHLDTNLTEIYINPSWVWLFPFWGIIPYNSELHTFSSPIPTTAFVFLSPFKTDVIKCGVPPLRKKVVCHWLPAIFIPCTQNCSKLLMN